MSGEPVPVAYARCPACGVLGPPGWISWPGESERPRVPVTIGCAGCGNQYVVSDPRDLHLEQDAVVWHWLCRTAIPCPAVAELVQCSVRTVNSPHVEGCLALIVGPAAGGEPPPPDEEPPPAFTLPPRTRRREPEGWW